MIRAETAVTSLKTAGEVISDSLLIAMVLKGLPAEYRTFSTVVTQKEKPMNSTELKVALRTFEKNENCQKALGTSEDNIMKMGSQESRPKGKIVCFSCGKTGHKSFECRNKGRRKERWCDNCKSHTHDTNFCRRRIRPELL